MTQKLNQFKVGCKSMRILMINVSCGSGSTGRICTDIAKELINQGNDVRIAYGRGPVSDKNRPMGQRIGSDFDVYVHVICSRIVDNMGFNSTNTTRKFISWIDYFKPDLIHLHNIHGYYLNVEILFNYIKTHNIPVVWTLHDCWAFTGHCAYFDIVHCSKWRKHCFSCPQKNEYPERWGVDRSFKNFEKKRRIFSDVDKMTIVTPSVWLQKQVNNSFLSNYNTVVINNGIDLEKFKYTPSELRRIYQIENKKVILGVSSVWDRRKGLDVFIKLANALDSTYAIVLIGITEKIKKMLPTNIIALRRTESIEELAQYYSMADVFVNPTLEDNYPTTNLEAIACGTPVITFYTGGSPESALYYGTAVPSNNINYLVDALKMTFNFKIKRDALSYKNTVNEYLELYRKLSKA